ncbi:hypothetical protein [Commensalibacter nepenthis]|uniref:Zinc ribbon domain-containing protein n=1 Tax=Commensalibacter nepenthis TaxID=3043872 RepID=A0ABT6Q846_9PROT|nr:hypothetical protein [Commensalibacter sp. TBRC 10068]MDI2113083.1 hypothetical protein [Commensalibacter sp. TBRC 10068]
MQNSHNAVYLLLIPIILSLITAITSYIAAKRKGRNAPLWSLFTFAFNPLLIILEFLPNRNCNNYKMVTCPACSERHANAARYCPHCGQPNQRTDYYLLTPFDRMTIIGEFFVCLIQSIILFFAFCITYYIFLMYAAFSTVIMTALTALLSST